MSAFNRAMTTERGRTRRVGVVATAIAAAALATGCGVLEDALGDEEADAEATADDETEEEEDPSEADEDPTEDAAGEGSGTVDLVDDGPIEFDTAYDDVVSDEREEARYLFDVPDGALLTLAVDNQRDSEHDLQIEVLTDGDTVFHERRLSPGDDLEELLIRGHDGGGEFEIQFSRGPAEYAFEVGLEIQQSAGQEGSAGDSAETAFEIEAGGPYEALLGGQDEGDVFLLDVQPGTDLLLDVEVDSASEGRMDVELIRDGSTLFRERRVDAGETYDNAVLFSGEDDGELELHFSHRGDGPVHYTFSPRFVEQEDGGEAGDASATREDAHEVPVGEPLTGQIGDFDEVDYYRFVATSDEMEVVVTNEAQSDGRFTAEVEDDNTERLDIARRVDPEQEAALSFDTEEGAEHVLEISENGRADYTFEIREAG